MSDPQNPGPPDDRPQDSGPGRSLWDQVPDADPWQPPPADAASRWSGEVTRAVPRVEPSWAAPAAAGPAVGSAAATGAAVGGVGGGAMENLVGSRIERARAAAAASGWELAVRTVDPEGGNQPDGMVVDQVPRPGTPMNPGSAVAVSVVVRRSWFARHPGALAAIAAVAALLVGALVGAAVAATADDDGDPAAATDPVRDARLTELTAANSELTTQVEALQAENQALQAQVAERQAGNDALTGQVQSLTAERDQAAADLQAAQQTIAELEAALADAGDDLAATESFIGTQVSAAQAYAENRNLELVVSETSTLPPGVSAAAPGTVLNQAPQPGVLVGPGSVIWVEVYVEPEDDGT